MSSADYNNYTFSAATEDGITTCFYDGLNELTKLPNLADGFGESLHQIAEKDAYRIPFAEMEDFYQGYQGGELQQALAASKNSRGVAVNVLQLSENRPFDLKHSHPGRIVGLVGGPDKRRRNILFGYAAIEQEKTADTVVPVAINTWHIGHVLRIKEAPMKRAIEEAVGRRALRILGIEIYL